MASALAVSNHHYVLGAIARSVAAARKVDVSLTRQRPGNGLANSKLTAASWEVNIKPTSQV